MSRDREKNSSLLESRTMREQGLDGGFDIGEELFREEVVKRVPTESDTARLMTEESPKLEKQPKSEPQKVMEPSVMDYGAREKQVEKLQETTVPRFPEPKSEEPVFARESLQRPREVSSDVGDVQSVRKAANTDSITDIRQERTYQYKSLSQPKPVYQAYKHQIIGIYSPKGGVGKSSITKELAAALSTASDQSGPLNILVVDADWEFGDITTLFNVVPRPNVIDWIKDMEADKRETGHIHLYPRQEINARYVIHYSDTLDILAGPANPMEAEMVTAEMVTAIMESLRRSDYDVILIDSANSGHSRTLTPLMMSDAVVLIETLDTSTVAETSAVLNTLRSMQFDFDKLYMVLNRVPDDDARIDISVSEIARLLQLDIAAAIPEYDLLRLINNAGEAAVLKKPTSYSKAVYQLANQLIPIFDKPERKGFFSFLFKRKKGKRR